MPIARAVGPYTTISSLPEFEKMWANPLGRIRLVSPKGVLAIIAREVQRLGGRPVSDRSISAAMKDTEVDEEMAQVLLDIDYVLSVPS